MGFWRGRRGVEWFLRWGFILRCAWEGCGLGVVGAGFESFIRLFIVESGERGLFGSGNWQRSSGRFMRFMSPECFSKHSITCIALSFEVEAFIQTAALF